MKRRASLDFSIFLVLLAASIGGLVWVNYRYSVRNPGGNDFLARWMGARMWLMDGTSPYDDRVSLATQQQIYGHPADPAKGEDVNHFVYPLHAMVFFAPLGLLEYLPARVLWMTLLEICLAGLVFVSLRLTEWEVAPVKLAVLLLFSLMWYHGLRTIVVGQFAGVNAVLIGLGLLFIWQKSDVAAGVFLALSTSKPQMVFLLVPFVLLWAVSRRRWGLVWGLVGGSAALLVASLALIPDWPLQMLRQMLEYPEYTNIGSPISIIANAMPGIGRTLNGVLTVSLALYLLIEWALAWGKDERWFLWTALMTLVVTNLVALRTATTNYVVLLPVLFLIFRVWEQRWKRAGRVGVWVSLAGLLAGLWGLFIVTVQGNVESAWMYLPLPFFCLFGLWWVRWWAVRPPRLMLEDFSALMR